MTARAAWNTRSCVDSGTASREHQLVARLTSALTAAAALRGGVLSQRFTG
jgi:hypothetical protein